MTLSRTDALSTIRTLIAEHHLTRDDVLALLITEADVTSDSKSGGMLQRLMVYLGGAFIFVGLCVYIGMIWDDIGSIARVIVSFGSGLVAFIMGLVCLGDVRFQRAATPLFLIAAALEPTGLFVFMDEYLPHSGDVAKAATVVFGFMLIQQGVAFIGTQKTSLLFFSLLFFYSMLFSLMGLWDLSDPEDLLVPSLTGLMVAWGVAKTPHHAIAPFFYFCAAATTAISAFDLFENSPLDILLIGVAAALIYLSTYAASRTLLLVGVVSLLAYLGYYTDEYFMDIVGWPIALIIMGMIMIGISFFAVKLGQKIAKQAV
ncbi:MAG: hypothetical protein WC043_06270 [Pseudobdellovibrionaceae bacterium]